MRIRNALKSANFLYGSWRLESALLRIPVMGGCQCSRYNTGWKQAKSLFSRLGKTWFKLKYITSFLTKNCSFNKPCWAFPWSRVWGVIGNPVEVFLGIRHRHLEVFLETNTTTLEVLLGIRTSTWRSFGKSAGNPHPRGVEFCNPGTISSENSLEIHDFLLIDKKYKKL